MVIEEEIKKIRSSLNPKELFLSKAFRRYCENIVSGLTRESSHKAEVVIKDSCEDYIADVTYKKRSNIRMNIGHPFLKEYDIKSEYILLMGLLMHECGHIIWTHDEKTKEYSKREKRYRQILTQGIISFKDESEFNKVNEILKKNQNLRGALAEYFSQISNCIEDAYIEIQLLKAFPGYKIYLDKLRHVQLRNASYYEQMLAEDCDEFTIIHDMILYYAKYKAILCEKSTVDQTIMFIRSLYPILDQARVENSAFKRAEFSALITAKVFLYFSDQKQQNASLPQAAGNNGNENKKNEEEGNGSKNTSKVADSSQPNKDLQEDSSQQEDKSDSEDMTNKQKTDISEESKSNKGEQNEDDSNPNVNDEESQNLESSEGGEAEEKDNEDSQQNETNKGDCENIPNDMLADDNEESNHEDNKEKTEETQNDDNTDELDNASDSGEKDNSESDSDSDASEEENDYLENTMESDSELSEEDINDIAESLLNAMKNGADLSSVEKSAENSNCMDSESSNDMPGDKNNEESNHEDNKEKTEETQNDDNTDELDNASDSGEKDNSESDSDSDASEEENDYLDNLIDDISMPNGDEEEIEKEFQKMLPEYIQEKLEQLKEKEIAEDNKKLQQAIDFGKANKNVSCTMERYQDFNIQEYETFHYAVQQDVSDLVAFYKEKLKDTEIGMRMDGLYLGTRFSNPYRFDLKRFSKERLPEDLPDMTFSVYCDQSGSTSGARNIAIRKTALMIYEFCQELNIPCTVYGHYESDANVVLTSYAEPESMDGNDGARIASMKVNGCNRDGYGLRYLSEKVSRNGHKYNAMFVLSDGLPNGYNYNAEVGKQDIQDVLMEYSPKIKYIVAGIGHDATRLSDIYRDHLPEEKKATFISITDVDSLASNISDALQQYVRGLFS